MVMLLNDVKEFPNFNIPQPLVQYQLNRRLQPELGFAIRRSDMNVDASFFPREKEKPILLIAEDSRTHAKNVARSCRT
jgi:hypothetical protein